MSETKLKTPPLPPERPVAKVAPMPANLGVSPPQSAARLTSLDALRGFDMCWILGLDAIFRGLASHLSKVSWVPDSLKPSLEVVREQLDHVKWAGLRWYDCIFPLFLFLSGVSMAISVSRRQKTHGTASAARHLIWRAIVICVIGVIYSGGIRGVSWDLNADGKFIGGADSIRLMGVLQRIGIASAAAGLLSLWLGTRGLVVALVTILVGYWGLMTQVPVPVFPEKPAVVKAEGEAAKAEAPAVKPEGEAGKTEVATPMAAESFGKGNLETEGRNLANYVDYKLLPLKKYDKTHDPEGLLSTLPAIATALLGLLVGKWLFGAASPVKKASLLFLMGAALAGISYVWHANPAGWPWFPTFPIIKKVWTSSFVLAAGGISMMLLALFYAIIDIAKLRFWATPFIWVGANPIALYLISGAGGFRNVAARLTGTCPAPWTWIPSLVAFLVMLTLARFLYKRNIYIRI